MTVEETRRRVGRRGAVLLILAAVDVGVGLSFVYPTAETVASQSWVWRETFAPSAAWGLLWIAVGCCCFVAAFLHNDLVGFVAAVTLKVLWSGLELTGWLAGQITQGYRPALIWAGYALLIFAVAGLYEPTRAQPPDRGGRP